MKDTARDTSDEGIAAIADPVQRAQALRAISKRRGNLTPAQARLYSAALAEMRGDDERKQTWIARRLGVSRQAVSKILRRHSTALAEEAAA